MYDNVFGSMNFNAEKFLEETEFEGEDDPESRFWQFFHIWKSDTEISGELYSKCMFLTANHISGRIDGIMKESRTKYYEECAAFIAAYGEVLESNGSEHAKDFLMEKYREEYPRRRSFIAALRYYGMKG